VRNGEKWNLLNLSSSSIAAVRKMLVEPVGIKVHLNYLKNIRLLLRFFFFAHFQGQFLFVIGICMISERNIKCTVFLKKLFI